MKFTNLKRGIAGVCAATLLTGMCVAPAFAAAVTPSVSNGGVDSSNAAKTTINAQVDGQLSATVPTTLTVGISSADGSLIFPADSELYIENTSSAYGIHVVSIEASAGSLLDQSSAFASSTAANAAWLKIGTTSADKDLSSKLTVADASWDVASASKLPIKFAGAVKNVNTFDPFTLTTLTWTIGGGLYA
ncbi:MULTISPECIES: hypothetical protein [Gordonibacter]|uniref:WxL domain-containing protein n=1 Tax=Gordonibacter faecis TaxID=3047475 RepID=A0ABT7DMV9_9ACTN|nr:MULTISPECIES: hypothetical protein [unclassified Gordonibacter]MDJ1650878.1 hypothetical protein [Gordonibacter sp. KGMB12511]HIW77299.1 hypothetical protein [Candidatus Gordonibacter avicola]